MNFFIGIKILLAFATVVFLQNNKAQSSSYVSKKTDKKSTGKKAACYAN
jgi:hypothetical protein